ncbi:hypothetical protein VM98_13650 [Streptomyces rubellomurinus subsp. indigoferus]|nr:hypothetical protein VM98_13650 [Streptomyces rubellomurinus subsp. indigoferus]
MSKALESGPDEAAAVRELGELAGGVDPGAVPYDRLIAGGRRRLRRRRTAVAGAAAALVVAVCGAGAVIGAPVRGSGAPITAAAAPGTDGRDPFTPVRVKIGEGTSDGHTWQAWAALWPGTATEEDGRRQARLIRADRSAADPRPQQPTAPEAERPWTKDLDLVDVYLTLDGKRQADDSVTPVAPPPAHPTGDPVASTLAILGVKGGAMGDSPAVIVSVPFGATRVAVDWGTGGSTEATPVAVANSPTRWCVIAKKPGTDATTVTYYSANGEVTGSTGTGYVQTP